jgi:hypothetical protein
LGDSKKVREPRRHEGHEGRILLFDGGSHFLTD